MCSCRITLVYSSLSLVHADLLRRPHAHCSVFTFVQAAVGMIYFAEFVWPDDTFVPCGTCLLTWVHCCKLCTVAWGLWPEVNSCRNGAGIYKSCAFLLVLKHCVERGRDASSLLMKCCVAVFTFGGRWTRPSNVFSVCCRYFQCYLISEERERKKKD